MKKVIIIGAGPAGLTAGYELLSKSSEYDVTIVEESLGVGGMCARHEYNGKNLDLGGHMLISHNPHVKKIWNSLLPAQGVASFDDLSLDRYCKINNGGPNPAETDNVMLSREKVHRVLDEGRLIDSPVRLNRGTIKTFGFGTSVKSGFSQIGNSVFKHKETTLENYYLNRYGKQLYSMFLENYTEKVWGKRPSQISSALGEILENDTLATVVCCDRNMGRDLEKASAAFVNRYYYPKKGISYLFEEMSDRFIEMGGSIHRNCKVVGIVKEGNEIIGINCFADDERFFVPCDILISSMPIKDMINGMDDIPSNVKEINHGLSYRGLITFGVDITDMKMKNDREEPTIRDIVPDSVIYINDPKGKLGRIQIYNNFSPYLSNDNSIHLGLNYYCNEGDYYWNLNDVEWNKIVVNDLKNAGIIYNADDIVEITKAYLPKAFPGYFDTYDRLGEVITYLNSLNNLYCIGRNGQHRMSSVDEAMLTAIEAVRCITHNVKDKSSIWEITEMFNASMSNENKLYNSALLGEDVEYRGNVPVQRMDTLNKANNADSTEEKPQIRRMRRPMMTPIKKADPEEAGKLSEPIIIDERVVIAARPNKTIPIDIPSDMEEITASSLENNVSDAPTYEGTANNYVEQPTYVNNEYIEPVNNTYENVNSYVAPVNAYEAPVNAYEAPANTYEAPAYNYETQTNNYEAPANEVQVNNVYEASINNSYDATNIYETSNFNTYEEPVVEETPVVEANSYEEPVEDTLYSINEEAATKSIVKSWSVVTSEKAVAKDSDIVKPVTIFNTANKFEELKDVNSTDKVIEKNEYSSFKSYSKPVDNFDDVANNYELPPIVEKPSTPPQIIKSEGTMFKSNSNTDNYESAPVRDTVKPVTEKPNIITNDYSSIYNTSYNEPTLQKREENVVNVTEEVAPVEVIPTVQTEPAYETPVKKTMDVKPQYTKKEIDTSIVFKNARVIKSTKISSDQPLVSKASTTKKNDSSLDSILGNKSKVIAVIKNGEVVPVKKEEEKEVVKKPRTKKAPKENEEVVAAPISVVLDANETAQMTEALEQPKKRTRKRKTNTEEGL